MIYIDILINQEIMQGRGQSADQSGDQWNLIQRSKDSLLGDQMTAIQVLE